MSQQPRLGSPAAFAARDLVVRFGGLTALDGVSVSIASSEVLGVIGPNGAGKTTLFNSPHRRQVASRCPDTAASLLRPR